MMPSKPSAVLTQARQSTDGWVWFGVVNKLLRTIARERVPAKDIIVYARQRRLTRYLDELRVHFKGNLYLLTEDEATRLGRELAACRAQARKLAELHQKPLAGEVKPAD
jgi:uncharacterized membrane protein YccC